MSLDKAIEHGKERRKPYRGAKAIDPTCRNHGSCPFCEENRKHKFRDKHPDEREEKVNGYYDSVYIDCSPGTGREHMDISRIAREMQKGE